MRGSWAHFGTHEVLRGAELLKQRLGTQTEIGGALDVARERGIELVPFFGAISASSAGPIREEVFKALRDELVHRLLDAGSMDGLFLSMHGGTVAEGFEDACGEVLRAVRVAIGSELPLISTLDLHANVTRQMAGLANCLVGYHTYPHIDLYETGQRGMELLFKIITGQAQPTMAMCQIPMILPGENGLTTRGPYAEVMAMVEALGNHPAILDASAFSVQPWLDVQEVGCSVVVIADGDHHLAEAEGNTLGGGILAAPPGLRSSVHSHH